MIPLKTHTFRILIKIKHFIRTFVFFISVMDKQCRRNTKHSHSGSWHLAALEQESKIKQKQSEILQFALCTYNHYQNHFHVSSCTFCIFLKAAGNTFIIKKKKNFNIYTDSAFSITLLFFFNFLHDFWVMQEKI